MALSVVRSEFSPAELLARLQAGDHRPLDDLYRHHRPAFILWAGARHPTLSEDDLADAFQEALIVFYENIASQHLTELQAAPSTYVFNLGERFCLKNEKKSARTINNLTPSGIKDTDNLEMTTSGAFPDLTETLEDDPFGVAEFEAARTDRFEQVTHALRNLTPFCHRLLTAIFYSSRSREELMEEFGYEAARVLATRKSQCLAKLRILCGGAR